MNEKSYYREKIIIDTEHYADASFCIDENYSTADIYFYSSISNDFYNSVYIGIGVDEICLYLDKKRISMEVSNIVSSVINAMLSIINMEVNLT